MEYRIGGNLSKVNPDVLAKKLITQFPDLQHRPRIFGYDIKLLRKELELYLTTLDEDEYQLEASFTESEERLIQLLTCLKSIFTDLSLKFDIWYCLEDNDGNQFGEEVIFFDNTTGTL